MNFNFLFSILSDLKLKPYKIEALRGDGSDRKFFRLFFKNETFILILPQKDEYGLKEAKAYYSLGNFFKKYKIPVPEIKFYEPKRGILLIEDLGNCRLYDLKRKRKFYYYQALEHLSALQSLNKEFPLEDTLDTPFYDFEFLWEKEVKYFLQWYVEKYKKISLDEKFVEEFKIWVKEKANFNNLTVMHRDFQSKNLMIKKKKVYIIDFQGARLGPPGYDVASLLYDPYAELEEKRKELLDYYLALNDKYNKELFKKELKFLSLIRLMQTLGAYCKLSLKDKKIWFKNYIYSGEKRLKTLIKILKEEGEKNLPSLLLFFFRFL